MNYQDYKQLLLDAMWDEKPVYVSEYKIQSIVQKETIDDIVIPVYEGRSDCIPHIDLKQYYDYAITEDEIKKLAIDLTAEVKEAFTIGSAFDVGQITTENAKKHLYLKMENPEYNPEIEKNCAHINCMDLIATPRWTLEGSDGARGPFLVTRDLQRNALHMTDDELLQIALSNSKNQEFRIRGMNSIIREMMREVPEEVVSEIFPADEGEVMYVMTNAENTFGADAMLFPGELKKAAAVVGESSFYVVPSSIHELVIVPISKVPDPSDLVDMMMVINEDHVAQEDRLGANNIYIFDGQKLHICNTIEQIPEQKPNVEEENRQISQRRTL